MDHTLVVYAEQASQRLCYVLDYLFVQQYQIGYRLETPASGGDPAVSDINYSNRPGGKMHIAPQELLFERGLRRCEPRAMNWEGFTVPRFGDDPHETFDLFASVFFLLSRYEEHYFPKTDVHGRPLPDRLWQVRYAEARVPVLDQWVNAFAEHLNLQFGLSIKKPAFTCLSTLDIDNGYRFKGKGWKRALGGSVKDIKSLQFKQLRERWSTLFALRKDDFDIYDELLAWHRQWSIPLCCFILNAKKGGHDHGLPRNSKALRRIVQKLQRGGAAIGIHPSYSSNRHAERFTKEVSGLSQMAGTPITQSRQHYLRMQIQQTYTRLLSQGIKEDFTMGFAPVPGFRAGTCRAFYYYHMEEERQTDLLIRPFAIMEGTLKDYMGVHAIDALSHILPLVQQVQLVGGCFISIWHEAQLAERSRWRKVYLELMEYLSQQNRSN
ncbi:MAG TPA: polysaccharide deacetylase family protein [Luteibaculaceae bacterium]|nr:polysaccharide deacetylase family protein [Luteibaculaceae bacterium]